MTLRVTLDPAALDAGKDDNRARREPEQSGEDHAQE